MAARRRVDGVGGEVEEEGRGFVAVDELDGFGGEGVGEVSILFDGFVGAANGVVAFGGHSAAVTVSGDGAAGGSLLGDEGVAASQEAEEFVEATFDGMIAGTDAEMPFADGRARYPSLL